MDLQNFVAFQSFQVEWAYNELEQSWKPRKSHAFC